MEELIYDLLKRFVGASTAESATPWVLVCVIGMAAWLIYVVCVRLLIPLANILILKTDTKWDDDLLNNRVLKAVAQLAPAIWVASTLPDAFLKHITVFEWTGRLTKLYILWAAVHLLIVFLSSFQDALDKRQMLKRHNLEIVRQTLVLFVVAMGIIVGIGIIINRSPVAILTALGASAAVLMLVFRDTLLNFTAGIQLTVNKMVSRGDWIVCQKAGANGEVVEIKLTTVKIRNWDNSIVTVPPYTLFTESFQNFQAMRLSGGRRVSRSVLIDVNSVRFLNKMEIEKLRTKELLEGIEEQAVENVVNLTLFRHYIEHFLSQYPEIINHNDEMLYMVRQLQPTPQGIPVELYFFTSRTSWKPYEHLQADVFDHIYAVVGQFGLRIYQAPSGRDILALSN